MPLSGNPCLPTIRFKPPDYADADDKTVDCPDSNLQAEDWQHKCIVGLIPA